MTTPGQLQVRVKKELQRLLGVANAHYKPSKAWQMPNVRFDQRGTTAGTAAYRTWTVNFNMVLLQENPEDFMKRTVPHELAHLIDFDLNDKSTRVVWTSRGIRRAKRDIHGTSWREVMMSLGVPYHEITRCHSYDTTNARVKERVRYEYACSHGTIMAGPKHHAAIQRGQSGIRVKRCGCALVASMLVVHKKEVPVNTLLPKQKNKDVIPPRPGSKLDQAVQIVGTHAGCSRQDLIKIIARDCGMSPAGASTYYYQAKKKLEGGC